MLRVAIPYGELSGRQLRQLARIAREHDPVSYTHLDVYKRQVVMLRMQLPEV